MLEGLGLDAEIAAQLEAELKADFANKTTSLTRIEWFLSKLRRNTAAAGVGVPAPVETDVAADITTKKSCLRLFLLAKRQYLTTGNADLITAVLRQDLSADVIEKFVALGENKTHLEALQQTLSNHYHLWRKLALHPHSHLLTAVASSGQTQAHGTFPKLLREGKLKQSDIKSFMEKQRPIQAAMTQLANAWNTLQELTHMVEVAHCQEPIQNSRDIVQTLASFLQKLNTAEIKALGIEVQNINVTWSDAGLRTLKQDLANYAFDLRDVLKKRVSPEIFADLEKRFSATTPDAATEEPRPASAPAPALSAKTSPLGPNGLLWWRSSDAKLDLNGADFTGHSLLSADLRNTRLHGATLPRDMQLCLWEQYPEMDVAQWQNTGILGAHVAVPAGKKGSLETAITPACYEKEEKPSRLQDGRRPITTDTKGVYFPGQYASATQKGAIYGAMARKFDTSLTAVLRSSLWITANPWTPPIHATDPATEKALVSAAHNAHLLRCIVKKEPLVWPERMDIYTFGRYLELKQTYDASTEAEKTLIADWMQHPYKPTVILDRLRALHGLHDLPHLPSQLKKMARDTCGDTQALRKLNVTTPTVTAAILAFRTSLRACAVVSPIVNMAWYCLRYPGLAIYEKLEPMLLMLSASKVISIAQATLFATGTASISPLAITGIAAITLFSLARKGPGPVVGAITGMWAFHTLTSQALQIKAIVDFVNHVGPIVQDIGPMIPFALQFLKLAHHVRAYQLIDKPTATQREAFIMQSLGMLAHLGWAASRLGPSDLPTLEDLKKNEVRMPCGEPGRGEITCRATVTDMKGAHLEPTVMRLDPTTGGLLCTTGTPAETQEQFCALSLQHHSAQSGPIGGDHAKHFTPATWTLVQYGALLTGWVTPLMTYGHQAAQTTKRGMTQVQNGVATAFNVCRRQSRPTRAPVAMQAQ